MVDSKEKSSLEYWLALSSVKGLGNTRIKRLITHFGGVQAVFDAEAPDIAQLPSLTPTLASRIQAVADDLPTFREKLDALRSQNIRVLCLEDPTYPVPLKTIPDAPGILCSIGELTEVDEPCVAIVGTREPTAEGIQLTLALAIAFALAGFTVVSGLASGIDTCAHAGALAGSGKTIAVLGTDVLNIYPAKNRQLATDIRAQGCLLSEHPFRTSASPRNLVQRNRIISGLSVATIVIEARKTGGTLHTARFAQRQGRPLLSCRWEEDRGREGTRALIKNGAFPFAPNEIDRVVDVLRHPEQFETWGKAVLDRDRNGLTSPQKLKRRNLFMSKKLSGLEGIKLSELQRKYWTELRNYMQQEGIQLKARQPRKDHLQVFEIGRRTFCLEVWIYKRDPEHGLPQIGVRLRMSGRDGPAHFHLLKRQSEEIVKELGETPKWREYPSHRNLNIVYLDKSNVDVTDETDWPNQHAWLASKLEKFNEVFQPRIMTLNAANWEPPEDEDEA